MAAVDATTELDSGGRARSIPTLESLRRTAGADVPGQIFYGVLTASVLIALAIILAVLGSAIADGWDIITTRPWNFLTSAASSSNPAIAGVSQGIIGSLMISGIVAITAFPIGIGAALYLEEYAEDNWITRTIEIAVRNLAAVPSIVYGLLGSLLFVQALRNLTGGSTVIAAGLTLTCLVLPIVVITAAEAIRAVPSANREAAYGLGATQWEVIRTSVLPVAAPGILTGIVLSIARAIGEAAPLLVVGAVAVYSSGFQSFLEQTQSFFAALPMNVWYYARLPAPTWRGHAAASAVAVLLLVFLINSIAIWLRARLSKRLGR